MITSAPDRHYTEVEGREIYDAGPTVRSAPKNRGGGPSPSPVKARQSQRRYRSLFHQAAKEYQGWCEGELDSQRALGSVFHLLDRLRMLEPGHQTEDVANLGGLEHLPGCVSLLVRKHTVELERVMRLWRALVHQMKSQVSRVEKALAEAWQLHRSEARGRPAPPSKLTSLSPDPRAVHPQEHPSASADGRSPGPSFRADGYSYLETCDISDVASLSLSPSGALVAAREQRSSQETVQSGSEVSSPGTTVGMDGAKAIVWRSAGETGAPAVVGGEGLVVGPADYLQWLGDLSSMLVHEQWRKEELLSRVDFGPEAASGRVRAHVQAQWSSRSVDSFLDRTSIDAALSAAQVVPLARAR